MLVNTRTCNASSQEDVVLARDSTAEAGATFSGVRVVCWSDTGVAAGAKLGQQSGDGSLKSRCHGLAVGSTACTSVPVPFLSFTLS